MTKETESVFALRSSGGDESHPVLEGVDAQGRLDGVLFSLTLRQTYRNLGPRTLEVVYTFPLPPQAVLLGFAAELGGKRLDGTVLPRQHAERQYEDALAEGDSPILLEAAPGGLHTANIGNLKPGDQIVLEVRLAQWLAFDQGRLRLTVPTTIAPRFGAPATGGLLPHQVPPVSLDAEYPLSLAFTVAGSLGAAAVDCPTHRFERSMADGELRLALAPGATLDRDMVLVVTPREPRPSLLMRALDGTPGAAPHVALAAFQLPAGEPRARVALKLLVDCSGSMAGDSIASARQALRAVAGQLSGEDTVSLSRFGTSVSHELAPIRCSAAATSQLGSLLDAMQADLGGTVMHDALDSVFAMRMPGEAGDPGDSDVLLITDGEVWNAEPLVQAARASRQRVFAIGVGSSPAEGVLRQLAEASGGACEFATPGESLNDAALRMMRRIRQAQCQGVRVAWGGEAAWQTPLPAGLFGGDTVLAMAGFQGEAPAGPVRLLARDAAGIEIELARTEAEAPCPGDVLARMAAARRLQGSEAVADEAWAARLALDYQLLGPMTRCVLVHRRADDDKATEQAELHRVSSMLAAGWGGMGSVMDSEMLSVAESCRTYSTSARPTRLSKHASSPNLSRYLDLLGDSAAKDAVALLPRLPAARKPPSLRAVMLAVTAHFNQGGALRGLAADCSAGRRGTPISNALRELQALSIGVDACWLLLALWVARRPGADGDVASAALLAPHAAAIDLALCGQAFAVFERFLDHQPSEGPEDSGRPSREVRLSKAMRTSAG